MVCDTHDHEKRHDYKVTEDHINVSSTKLIIQTIEITNSRTTAVIDDARSHERNIK